MGWVGELCNTLSLVDPGFAAAIVPAGAADMARLASLIGRKIPEDYAEFLATMGASDGGLFYLERCDTRLSSIIAYLDRQTSAGRRLEPARCIPIAIGADFGGFCLTMADRERHPPVALLEALEAEEIVFPSLPAMAFAKAFIFELGATGNTIFIRALVGETADTLVDKYLAAGYQREWFSFKTRIYLRRGSLLTAIATDRPARPTLQLGGHDDASVSGSLIVLQDMVQHFEHRELRQETLVEIRASNQRIAPT